jgi:hypothetical protein
MIQAKPSFGDYWRPVELASLVKAPRCGKHRSYQGRIVGEGNGCPKNDEEVAQKIPEVFVVQR